MTMLILALRMLSRWLTDLMGIEGFSTKAAWKHIVICGLVLISTCSYQLIALTIILKNMHDEDDNPYSDYNMKLWLSADLVK